MGGEKEALHKSSQHRAEQPRLVAADGGKLHWPEPSTQQEIPLFLRAVGQSKLLSAEKELKREQQRQRVAAGRQQRRDKDSEAYLANEAAKMQRYRETGTTKAPEPPDTTSRSSL
jgi:hypothetical protein